MIKLICPICNTDKVFHVPSVEASEDLFQCEKCKLVFSFSGMEWETIYYYYTST